MYNRIFNFLRTTTTRLALSYLAIIMIMSIGFSFVFYAASSHELDRQLPPPSLFQIYTDTHGNTPNYHGFFERRIDEGRTALLQRLVAVNLLALLAGALLSYYLAQETLRPIEETMEAQSRFVTDASHELRTPLTALITSNEVALRKNKLSLPQAKEVIASNLEEVSKLKELTDGLLTLSKHEGAPLELLPVSLQDITGDAINRVIAPAQAKHISIDDEVPDIKVLGDATGLAQVVAVLLDNAIKYSPEKTTIYLGGAAKNDRAYLSVRDEGAGIAEADLPHIFDRFYRADLSRTKSDTNGYGIGLSIAKQIIDQHGGVISVAETSDKGSTFLIELPLAANE